MSGATSTIGPVRRRQVSEPTAAAPSPKPRAVVGIAVALWVGLLGLATLVLLTLAAWVTANHHDDAVRPALSTAVQGWLLAHHVGLAVVARPPGSFTIAPLSLTILLALLLGRAGRQAARLSGAEDLVDCATTALAVAIPYGVIAALMTSAGRTDAVRPSALQALAGAFVLALICVAFGALRETRQLQALVDRVPTSVRMVTRAGLAAAAVMVGGGAAVVVLSLAGHASRAAELVASLGGGVSGAILMAVVSMAYVPNAIGWAIAYSVGPGFAVGTGTTVGLGGVRLGAVPALPLFAPLPHSGSAPLISWAVVAVPLGAGVIAGWLTARARLRDDVGVAGPWWVRHRLPDAAWAASAGACCGVLIGLLAWASRGSLGAGRMAELGPTPWWVGLACALEVGLVAAASVWVAARLGERKGRSSAS